MEVRSEEDRSQGGGWRPIHCAGLKQCHQRSGFTSYSNLAQSQGVRKESQRFASQNGDPRGVKDKHHLADRKSALLAVGL